MRISFQWKRNLFSTSSTVTSIIAGRAILSLLAAPLAVGGEPVQTKAPVVFGVDTAGETLLEVHGVQYWRHEPFYAALDELGAGFVVVHLMPVSTPGKDTSAEMGEVVRSIDAGMRTHGKTYALNLETPNFVSRMEITPGVNEFEQPGGRHLWLLRPEWLRPILDQPGPAALKALVYDEAEHMQLSNNKFAGSPGDRFDAPFLVNTKVMGPEAAYDALVAECVRIREQHYGNRIPLTTEQVWPDLFHIFARAGWTAVPKLLKEHFTPVVLCIALGAALQYQDKGIHFWASPDLWGFDQYPGHSPEALRSALLMGYWLGAECLYVENIDFDRWEKRHPKADAKGSLVHWSDENHYELTAHGKVVRDFAKEYVPQHPRTVDWRQYRPRVAIIRLPDGGWGQFSAESGHGEAASRNRLLGNPDMPLDEPAREWLHVWSALTHGVVKPGAISYNNPIVYPAFQDFFVPVDSVAVFDHQVTGPVLDGVDCFVVCGHALSADTFSAVAKRVKQGTMCIIARRLFSRHNPESKVLPGKWTVLDRFDGPELGDALRPFLGPADEARYRFVNGTVVFRRGAEDDSVETKGL